MRTLKLSFLAVVATLMMGTSCKKYEEGPSFSLISKKARISNTWTIEKTVASNGTVTEWSASDRDAYTLEMKKDGTYTTKYNFGSTTLEGTGTWEFGDKKESVITRADGTSNEVDIILLKNKEWGTKDKDGNKTYYIEK